ncbi:hypothetical protein EJB05_39886, partial [Eragrostis curvula]
MQFGQLPRFRCTGIKARLCLSSTTRATQTTIHTMAAKVSLFLAVLLLATHGLVPTAVALISSESMPKSANEKMETPLKAGSSVVSATGAGEEKGYFAGH